MQLEEGRLLYEGKYRIIRLIYESDFGYTYEAMCARTDTRVAIREFYLKNCCERHPYNDEVSASSLEKVELLDKMKRRFVEEGRVLFQFNHPNIAHVTDVFLQNGTAYYVMDYVSGTTLKEMVQQRGRLSESEALSYMYQLCDAIEYVHSKNRVHLDIRPANVIITPDGHVILVDFGFSKRLDPTLNDPNITGIRLATNSYSPLELSVESDDAITPVSDIYSLGATLYKLLTGNTPPDAAMLVDYPLAELPSNISPNVAQAIRMAMSPKKSDRPQSVGDFRRLLHAPVHAAARAGETNTTAPSNAGSSIHDSGIHNGNNHTTPMGGNPYGSNNSFSSRTGEFQNNQSYIGIDNDEATVVSPEPDTNRQSNISEINFGFDNISGDGNQTENDGDNGTGPTPGPSQPKKLWLIVAIVAGVLLLGGGLYWAYNFFTSAPSLPEGSSAISEGAPGTTLGTYADNNPELMGELGGHYWVDLGLPSGTKWATTNVGASSATDFGGYFAWGETDTKNVYSYDNAETYEKPMGEIGGNQTFDAAAKQWGQSWRLPSKKEYEELLKNCSYRWVDVDGVKGGLFTSKNNGQSIFFPAAGFRYGVMTSDTDASYVGTEGTYWTDTPTPNDAVQEYAYGLRLYGNSIQTISDKFHRGAGRSIRAVAK